MTPNGADAPEVGDVLQPAFFDRPADEVARDLIGKAIARRTGRTTKSYIMHETEAYLGPHDLACYSARGRTARTEAMFGAPGTLYIYLVYGIHLMLNVLTGPNHCGAAVLIRGAGETTGPGRLGRGLALTPGLNGQPASPATGLWFEHGAGSPQCVSVTARIGVGYAGPRWSRRKLRFVLKAQGLP
jgi:DNA-3-methyladenine glycosylase